MEIQYQRKRWRGADWEKTERSVADFVDSELFANVDNQLAQAQFNAERAQSAIGRLVEILANKGIFSLNDVLVVANRFPKRWPEKGEEEQSDYELKPS